MITSNPSQIDSPSHEPLELLQLELAQAKSRVSLLEEQLQVLKQHHPKWESVFGYRNLKFVESSLLENGFVLSPVPGIVFDDAGNLLLANRSFRVQLIEVEVKPHSPKLLKHVFPQNVSQMLLESSNVFAQGKDQSVFECKHPVASEGKCYRVVVVPFRDSEGVVYSMMASFLDISQHRNLESVFAVKQGQFRSLIEESDYLVMRMDGRFVLDYANQTALEVLHLSSIESQQVYLPGLVHADDVEKMAELLNGAVALRQSNCGFENRLQPYQKDSIFLQWSFHLSYDTVGQCETVSVIARDVSDQRNIHEQMRRAKEKAEAADRSKSEFLAMISHEIRTPMNAIIGLSDLLKESAAGEEEQELLNTISGSGHSLLNLINDVLDLSKVEAGRMSLYKTEMDLRESVDQVLNLFQFHAESKGVELRVQVDERIPDRILGDQQRVVQVLNNLVGNALKFTLKGHVELRLRCEVLTNIEELDLWSNQDGGQSQPYRIIFDIEDTGIGISPAQRLHLFKPFSQADPSIRRRFGGTGLGLVISQKLATMMGGGIELESELGVGSIFSFTLRADARPLCDGEAEVDYKRSTEAKIDNQFASKYPLEILVVDDVSHNRVVMKTLLKRMGYKPVLVADGSEALTFVAKERVDLIFMDMLMPEMNGIDASREIRIRQHDGEIQQDYLRIIALTANSTEQDKLECKEAGMDGFVCKPIKFSEIQRCIKETYLLKAEAAN